MFKLISATPSPYARKVRIALAEKKLPFELITEVPWDSTTATPKHNPLEKLPVLILDDGSSVYESNFIMQYLEWMYPETPLMPTDVAGKIAARRLEVLCDGVCDAFVLMFFEKQRAEGTISKEWMMRQQRKVDGGLREMSRLISDREFTVGDTFGLGDIAVCTVFTYLCVRAPTIDWRSAYPDLAVFSDRMEKRPSFAGSVPVPQKIFDKVV